MSKSSSERTRQYRERRLAEIEQMEKIPCACGCGTLIAPLTKQFKPAKYALGHNPGRESTQFKKGHDTWNKGGKAPWATETHKGKKLSPEEIEKRTQTRLERNGGVYQTKFSGHSPEWRNNVTEANRKRDMKGESNPFYGKSHSEQIRNLLSEQRKGKPGHPHTAEAKRKISEANKGEKHPLWRGGTGKLPYGFDFTVELKKLVLMRDNYTCKRCGITQQELGKKMHVHHLDHDKMNNNSDNLVASCPKCNNWASRNRDKPFLP